VTKTQSAGPISCLEHRATRVLHCAIVTRADVLMFPLLLQTTISNQMRPRRLRGAWFSRLLRHPERRRSGSILSPGTPTGWKEKNKRKTNDNVAQPSDDQEQQRTTERNGTTQTRLAPFQLPNLPKGRAHEEDDCPY